MDFQRETKGRGRLGAAPKPPRRLCVSAMPAPFLGGVARPLAAAWPTKETARRVLSCPRSCRGRPGCLRRRLDAGDHDVALDQATEHLDVLAVIQSDTDRRQGLLAVFEHHHDGTPLDLPVGCLAT